MKQITFKLMFWCNGFTLIYFCVGNSEKPKVSTSISANVFSNWSKY